MTCAHSPLYAAIASAREPDAVLFTFVQTRADGSRETPVRLAEVLLDVERAACALARSLDVRPGEPVLLLVAEPRSFLVAFLAVQEAGGIPVPLPSLAETASPSALQQRVAGVVADCRARVAIAEDAPRVRASLGTDLVRELVTLEDLLVESVAPMNVAVSLSDAAFVQYTSGSTGSPKGVVITHAQLLANCAAISAVLRPDDRVVSWLPLHHDMGLIGGLLSTLVGGRALFILTPADFVLNPLGWLRVVAATHATVTVAPPMAYALCTRRARRFSGDLSSLRVALVGSEPVDANLLGGFLDAYAEHGVRADVFLPVYGLAEATLMVTAPPPSERFRVDVVSRRALVEERAARAWAPGTEGDEPATFVSNGAPILGHTATIVDPATGAPLAERLVGEIVVEGPCVAARYFTEAIAAPLRTGDLGYLADGHLYVAGRIKDVVIVAGRNYAASDLEASLVQSTRVREGRVAAFPVRRRAGHEGVGIAAEVVTPGDVAELELEARAIVRAMLAATGVTPSVVAFLPPRKLPRTTSGKVQRQAVRKAFENGSLEAGCTRLFHFD